MPTKLFFWDSKVINSDSSGMSSGSVVHRKFGFCRENKFGLDWSHVLKTRLSTKRDKRRNRAPELRKSFSPRRDKFSYTLRDSYAYITLRPKSPNSFALKPFCNPLPREFSSKLVTLLILPLSGPSSPLTLLHLSSSP
jgi:hypothetical protein